MGNYAKIYERIEELKNVIEALKFAGEDYSDELVALAENEAYLSELDWIDGGLEDPDGDWYENEAYYELTGEEW